MLLPSCCVMYTVVSTSKIFDAFKQYKIGTVICVVLLKYVDYHTSKQVYRCLTALPSKNQALHTCTHTRSHMHTQTHTDCHKIGQPVWWHNTVICCMHGYLKCMVWEQKNLNISTNNSPLNPIRYITPYHL